MKTALSGIAIFLVLLTSCSKSKTEEPTPPSTNPNTNTTTTTTTVSILTDPVNCPPTLYQSNTNAFQFSFAKMKLIKGMTGQLTNITPTILANNSMHIYMRGTNGKYYHLPATTVAGIAYNYSFTSAFPQSSFSIKRGTGAEEVFETILVLGVNPAYASSFNPQLNFEDYGAVKLKLGF